MRLPKCEEGLSAVSYRVDLPNRYFPLGRNFGTKTPSFGTSCPLPIAMELRWSLQNFPEALLTLAALLNPFRIASYRTSDGQSSKVGRTRSIECHWSDGVRSALNGQFVASEVFRFEVLTLPPQNAAKQSLDFAAKSLVARSRPYPAAPQARVGLPYLAAQRFPPSSAALTLSY